MGEIQHGSHECALTSPEIVTNGICNICFKDETVEYACDPCNFDLCKACSDLPKKMSHHHLHPEHTLEFCIGEDDREPKYIVCFGCGNMSSGDFYYECKKCEIYLDMDCALQKSIVAGWVSKEMLHYSHEHLLRRCKPGLDAKGSCLLCELPLSPCAICYGCVHCYLFFHERCLDLPTKIEHPMHPAHTLKRLDCMQTFDSRKSCDACKGKFVGVPFGCLECGFYLHLRCADTLLRGLMHKSHEHRLLYVEDNGKVDVNKDMPCQICMDLVLYNRFYYLCVQCDLKFHIECLEIPKYVLKKSYHIHQLRYQRVRSEDDFFEYCGVCETMLHSGHPAYFCDECDFIGHTECILREEVPSPLYLKDLYTCSKGQMISTDLEDHETNELEDKQMIKGFDHIHVMRPVHMSELEEEGNCNICGGKIHDSPCKCETCSFQSHHFCVELGRPSRHQFHLNHPLTLLPYSPRCLRRKCESCKRNIDGFNLFCRICNFIIDINCALKEKKLLGAFHKGQKITGTSVELCMQEKHTLFQVIVSSSYPISCAICDEKLCGKALSCVTCGDICHPLCIQLGRRGLAGHPLHPDHILTITNTASDSCLACHLQIKKYGYSCFICMVQFHIECIKAVSIPEKKFHSHYLYHFWIDNPRVTRACNVCGKPCGMSFYGCIDCNFSAHANCIRYPSNVKNQRHQHTLTQIRPTRRHACSFCKSGMYPNRIYACHQCEDVFEVSCIMSMKDREATTEEEQLQDIYLMYLERDLFDLLMYNDLECDFLGHIECILRKEAPSPLYLKDLYSCRKDNTLLTDQDDDHGTNELKQKLTVNSMKGHIHVMRFVDFSELDESANCNICKTKILGSPCKCETCSFQSHNFCAELGRPLQHLVHKHPLTLLPKAPAGAGVTMDCNICKNDIEGFNLFCRLCNFIIHTNCIFKGKHLFGELQRGQKIIGSWEGRCIQNKHRLVQVMVSRSYPMACVICEEKVRGKIVSCMKCGDVYHPLCTEVGRQRTLRYPLHPDHDLRISFVSGSKCSACKLKIIKYGYHCSICQISFHIKCMKAVRLPRKIS